jgi:TrmH family RNA methyltransferase
MADISSMQNERVKYVVKLRDDKRQRQRDSTMLVEGCYELELALSTGLLPIEVYLCEELVSQHPAELLSLQPATVTRQVFEKMSNREGPDGWLAVLPIPHRSLETLNLSPNPILVLAESIEKPGNLGAMLRTADAAGVEGILVCDPRVDLYNPNVIRASRGTLFTVPAVETTSTAVLPWLRERGIRIIAASPNVDNVYTDADLSQPLCIAVGTEDKGLTRFWMENADIRVKIPMSGIVNSLNVSITTAVIIYESIRQRNNSA